MRESIAVFALLTGLGCFQAVADWLHAPTLRAVSTATHASPAPRVFTAHRGYETFSARLFLDWEDADGAAHTLELTPETYAGLQGPYNRRNAYGAAFAYGPLLVSDPNTRAMAEAVVHHAVCAPGTVVQEIGLPAEARARPVDVRWAPRDAASRGAGVPLALTVDCTAGRISL